MIDNMCRRAYTQVVDVAPNITTRGTVEGMNKEQRRPGFGSGVYTYHEAARLLRVHTTQVRRWAEGYVYTLNGIQREKKPILQRSHTGQGLLTFHDLIELYAVKVLREAKVKMRTIREASERLADELGTPYPFANQRIHTDGVAILRQAGRDYEDIVTKQRVFEFIRDFFKDIDFDRDKLAQHWYPLGREKLIVLDPHRAFGAPIDLKSGVRTDVLYLTYTAQKDVKAVADWYEVTPEAVKAAIEFEGQCQKAA